MTAMTDAEKFQFDLEGYLVVREVLSGEEVTELVTLALEAWPGEHDETGLRRESDVSQWGPRFRDLIDHPKLIPYLVELMGPKFRVDHDYSMFMRRGTYRSSLHGGPSPHYQVGGDHWYRYVEGTIRNGLTVFTYCLSDAGPGDGGFACVPGSHKSNLLSGMPDDVARFKSPAHYVTQPVVKAGDVIIFTEALVHGTTAWNADHERRALLYKYSPGHSSWSSEYYDPANYPGVTEQQTRIMLPPMVGSRPDSVQAN
jgi:ectoine hydroxylase-related dioxygenase (phytanoyl-CoA dioxygenase family)